MEKDYEDVRYYGYEFTITLIRREGVNQWRVGSMPALHDFTQEGLYLYAEAIDNLYRELDTRNKALLDKEDA